MYKLMFCAECKEYVKPEEGVIRKSIGGGVEVICDMCNNTEPKTKNIPILIKTNDMMVLMNKDN